MFFFVHLERLEPTDLFFFVICSTSTLHTSFTFYNLILPSFSFICDTFTQNLYTYIPHTKTTP